MEHLRNFLFSGQAIKWSLISGE